MSESENVSLPEPAKIERIYTGSCPSLTNRSTLTYAIGRNAEVLMPTAKALGWELGGLLGRRIEELADYEDRDLSELLHILVIEPSDATSARF